MDWMIVFSGVVALATAVYAYLTWKLVVETKRLRRVHTEPKILVYLDPREDRIPLVDIVIKNIGLGPAYDVKITVEPDLEYTPGFFLSQIGFIKDGFPVLAPNAAFKIPIDTFFRGNEKAIEFLLHTSLVFTVTYKNQFTESGSELSDVNFYVLDNITQIGVPPLALIAENVAKLQKNMDDLISGRRTIKVRLHDKNDNRRQWEERMVDRMLKEDESKNENSS